MKRLLLLIVLFLSLMAVKAQPFESYVYRPASLGYGALYNWYAASDANFAPSGYHVPTKIEWETLQTYLGGESVAGIHLKEIGTTHWLTQSAGTDNSSGFGARGGGYRISTGGYSQFRNVCGLMSSSLYSSYNYQPSLYYQNADFLITNSYGEKKAGMSVRLIKDNSTNEGDLTDIDGNVYHVVDINGQIWTTSNFKCTTLNNGVPIVNVTDNTAWSLLVTGAYCYYGNDIGNK